MYRLSVEEDRGYKALSDLLNTAGHHAGSGRPFSSFTIQRILSNEDLMGDLTYGKNPKKGYPKQDLVWVKGFLPAIFTEEEWQILQERLGIRRES